MILRSISIYSISTLVNSLVRFFILTIGARVLLLDDYGLLDTSLFIGLIFSSVIIMGYDSAVLRLSFDKDKQDNPSLLTTSLILIFFNTLLLTTLMAVIIFFVDHSFNRIGSGVLIACLAMFGFGFSLIAVASANLRAHFEEWRFLVATIMSAIIRVGALLPFLVMETVSLSTFMLTVCTSYLVSGFIFIKVNEKWLSKPQIAPKLMLQMMQFGVPIGVVVIISGAFPVIERMVVLQTGSLTILSIYAASAFPAMVLGIAIQVVNLAWTPMALKAQNDAQDSGAFIRKSAMAFQGAFIMLYLIVLWLSDKIVELFVPIEIEDASQFFPFLGLVVLVRFTSSFTSFGLIVEKRTFVKAVINTLGLLLGTVVILVAGSVFGMHAIPVALFISAYLTFFVEAIISRKYAPGVLVPYGVMASAISIPAIFATISVFG